MTPKKRPDVRMRDRKPSSPQSPNQIVGYRLWRARELRGLTQEEVGRRLAPYLGKPWNRATVAAAENSFGGDRIHPFDADELVAFARVFDLPVIWFLLPPTEDVPLRSNAKDREETLPAEELSASLYDRGSEDFYEELLRMPRDRLGEKQREYSDFAVEFIRQSVEKQLDEEDAWLEHGERFFAQYGKTIRDARKKVREQLAMQLSEREVR